MTDPLILGLTFIGGVALGVFYFGGLWVTVQYVARSRRPGLISMISLVVRMSITMIGLYLIMAGDWQRLVASVLGFFVARTVLLWRLRPEAGAQSTSTEGNRYEH